MGIKRVKLNYKPIIKRRSNEVAYVVSTSHVNAVNRSIENKITRNQAELDSSYLEASNYVVKTANKVLTKTYISKNT